MNPAVAASGAQARAGALHRVGPREGASAPGRLLGSPPEGEAEHRGLRDERGEQDEDLVAKRQVGAGNASQEDAAAADHGDFRRQHHRGRDEQGACAAARSTRARRTSRSDPAAVPTIQTASASA